MLNRSLIVLLILSLSPLAHAYLDPGTGSLLIQMFVAGFLGFLGVVKIYWGHIKAFFSGKPNKENSEKNVESKNESEDESTDRSA